MRSVIDYSSPGPFTDLGGVAASVMVDSAVDPVDGCRPVAMLVVQPHDAVAAGVSQDRLEENRIRPVAGIVAALLALDPAPLTTPRSPDRRVVGTCRHFAVLACALLRRRGVAARVRCGFATYFQAGLALDHWIVEYFDTDDARWVRVDAETLGGTVQPKSHDLPPGDFLTGGEAWAAYRRGEVDPATFGVYGTENFGPSEIRGNAVRDLAALNKVESLPWDEWGRMTDAYEGTTGPDYDALLDEVAEVCGRGDEAAVADLYQHRDLAFPKTLIR